MAGIEITLVGADEAHYLGALKRVSRLIEFPDGLSRHINLTKWQWEVFDRLIRDKGWLKNELATRVYRLALEDILYPADFEKQLRYIFKSYIGHCMPDVIIDKEFNPDNDQFKSL